MSDDPLTTRVPDGEAFSAAIHHHGQRHIALGRKLSRELVTVISDAPVAEGDTVMVSISTENGQGPLVSSMRVQRILPAIGADGQPRAHEFRLTFEEGTPYANLIEAFFIALARNDLWPDKSGRRFERFPVRLHVSYEYQDEEHKEHTENISRGGVFVESYHPPAVGTMLFLTFEAPGGASPVMLEGKVVHAISTESAAQKDIKPGAGIMFTDVSMNAQERLEQLLRETVIPAQKCALIVDDDRFFRTVIGNVLRLGGYHALDAGNAHEALRILFDDISALDAVILDLHMPQINGAEFLSYVRQLGGEHQLACVILSGAELDEEQRKTLMEQGADAVLNKMQDPDEILEIVENLVADNKSATRPHD